MLKKMDDIFWKINKDLYIRKEDVKKMEEGAAGIGYVNLPKGANPKNYEKISKHALLPIRKEHILGNGVFNVVFIEK